MRLINQIINQYTTPEQRKQLKKYGNKAINKVTTTVLKTLPPLANDVYTRVATSGVALKSGDDKVIKKQIKDLATDAAIEGASLIGLKGAGKAAKPIIKAIDKARVAAVKANPKAAQAIKIGTEQFRSKAAEIQKAIDNAMRKPQTIKVNSAKDIDKLGLPDNRVMSLEEGVKALEKDKDYIMSSPEEFLRLFGDATKAEVNAVSKAADKGVSGLSKAETDSILDMLKSDAKGLQQLAKDTGAKKSEVFSLMKFANQLGDIIKNSPNYIKSQATGKDKLGLLANAGLSIYDLYQAYKENDGSLLPKSLNNVARMAGGLIPGNPILKIFYGGLGYAAGDQLTKAAFKKLGVKHETSDLINKEIEAGIYQPGLSDEIPEFIEGQSGRKYHVTGNKIFDYATGRPVNIANALKDASDFVQFKTQEAIDKKNALEQQENDLRIAMQQGYNVDPSQLQNIQIQKETAQQEINRNSQLANQLQPLTYDSEGDLVEQYKQNVIAPEQQREQIQAQQTNQDIATAYNLIAEKVAYDSAADIDRLITPQSMLNEYHIHQSKARAGQGYFFNNINDFVEWKKSQAMIELQPKIREQAATIMQNGIKSQQELNKFLLEAQKVAETYRHNRATEAKDIYNAQTDRGYKQGQLDIGQYNAETGRINAGTGQYNAQTGRMNADTNRAELGIKGYNAETGRMNAGTAARDVARKEQLLPYQQASYAGQTVMNAGMSGLSMDQFLNSNTSVFGTVFPGTQQGQAGDGSVPYAQYKNQINQYYNQQ